MASGEAVEELWTIDLDGYVHAYDGKYDPKSNVLVSNIGVQLGGQFYKGWAIILDLDTGVQVNRLQKQTDMSGTSHYESSRLIQNDIYYFKRYTYFPAGNLKSLNFETMEFTILYNNDDFSWDVPSCILESTNSYIGYTNHNGVLSFYSYNLDSQTFNITPVNYNGVIEFFKTTDEILYGLKRIENFSYEIVKIDKTTGEITEVIHQINGRVSDLNFSESSNRFYFRYLEANGYPFKIYIYNLDTDTNSILTLDDELSNNNYSFSFNELMLKY